MEMREIRIDLGIFKALEAARTAFDETHNQILHRLLKVSHPGGESVASGKPPAAAWAKNGVVLEVGSVWRFGQHGKEYSGPIADGAWWHDGKRFNSPSALASALWVTKSGTKTKIDGWSSLKIKRPYDEEWRTLNEIQRLARR